MFTAEDWNDWPTWRRINAAMREETRVYEEERKRKRKLNLLFATRVVGQSTATATFEPTAYTASLDAVWSAATPRFVKRHTGFVMWRSSGGWYAAIGAREACCHTAFADTPAEALMLSCLRAVGVEGGEEIEKAAKAGTRG